MALYRDHAVVLRTWKLGEADRIVSLHTCLLYTSDAADE